MQTIVVCGNVHGDPLVPVLYSTLQMYGQVVYSGSTHLFVPETEPDFFLWEGETVPELRVKDGILLIRTGAKLKHGQKIPDGFHCILNSRSRRDAELLSGMGIPVVACGMGSRDTLSIASLDYGSAVLSLQRSLYTLQGTLLEPHDFQVHVEGKAGPAQILPTAMLLLLLGMDSGEGFDIRRKN